MMVTTTRAVPLPRKPTPAQRRFLVFLQETDGGWLPEDPFPVKEATVRALEELGWIRLECEGGRVVAACITSLGIAAYRWGTSALATAA